MSDRSAYFAFGAQLQISDNGSPAEFVDVYGCGSFDGPGRSRDTIETTNHSSPDARREYIGGLYDSDELTTTINWLFDDPGQILLEEAYEDKDNPRDFQLVYTFVEPNKIQSFEGIITNLTDAVPTDGAYTRDLTIKITGPVDETDAE